MEYEACAGQCRDLDADEEDKAEVMVVEDVESADNAKMEIDNDSNGENDDDDDDDVLEEVLKLAEEIGIEKYETESTTELLVRCSRALHLALAAGTSLSRADALREIDQFPLGFDVQGTLWIAFLYVSA